jgi:hypothetical protein
MQWFTSIAKLSERTRFSATGFLPTVLNSAVRVAAGLI